MLPLRDSLRARRFSILTYVIIALNIGVFGLEMSAANIEQFISTWGFIPARLLSGDAGAALTLITSQFLHGGYAHIGMNMWYLHIFGDNVEDAWGRWQYVIFYLVAGVAAALAQLLSAPSSIVPMVGASGAIAGVLGSYLALYPNHRILTMTPQGGTVQLPSTVVLGSWFVLQLFSGTASIVNADAGGGGVAFWAHAGGFAFGWAATKVLRRTPSAQFPAVSQIGFPPHSQR